MIKNPLTEQFFWNERNSMWISHILVALMMFSFGVTLHQFGVRLAPAWSGGYLPWLSMIIAAEAMYAYRFTHKMPSFSAEWTTYRGSELLFLIIGLRVFFLFREGAVLDQLAAIQSDFLTGFFSGEYRMAISLALLVWALGTRYAFMLKEMEGDKEILKEGSHPRMFTDRKEIRENIATMVFFIGMIMIIIAAMTRVQAEFLLGNRAPAEVSGINLLVYFVLGLLLLSQGQFAVLRSQWGWRRLPIQQDLAIAWVRYALVFLVILMLFVLVLPAEYKLGLGTTFFLFFDLLWQLISLFVFLLLAPCIFLFGLMMGSPEDMPTNPGFFELPPPPIPQAGGPVEVISYWDFFRSLLFWLVFLFVIGYAFVQFARQNEELWKQLQNFPGWKLLVRFGNWMKRAFGLARTQVGKSIQEGLQRLRERRAARAVQELWNFVRVNQLSPRQQVRFFYLAMARRGREQGVARKQSQTPQEYSKTLKDAVPPSSQDVDMLTDAFLEARYSAHEISDEKSSAVKAAWARLRRSIRADRKDGEN